MRRLERQRQPQGVGLDRLDPQLAGRLGQPELIPVGFNESPGNVSELIICLEPSKVRVVLQALGKIGGFQKSDCSQAWVTADLHRRWKGVHGC